MSRKSVLRGLPAAAEQTRVALVAAAMRLFGRQGFDGTSTREIAAAARANIGSIAYHFGGKEGLRTAVADHIVGLIRQAAGPALAELEARPTLSQEAAEAQLIATAERMVGFIVAQPEAGDIVAFVLRELSQPTEALDRIYAGVFEPVHKRLCALWEQATGEAAESERTRLTVFALIGQVVYFRIGREAVLRRMGWDGIGTAQAAAITEIVKENMAAVLASRKRDR